MTNLRSSAVRQGDAVCGDRVHALVVVLMCFSASYRIAVVAGVIWLVVLFAAYQITQKRA